MVLIFANLCLWRRSLRSNVGGMHSKKLYRATLKCDNNLLLLLLLLLSFFYRLFERDARLGKKGDETGDLLLSTVL